MTFIPYHGQAAQDPNEIRRGKARSGTTHFHCYATAYVIKSNKRVTLALTYVQADDTLVQILERIRTSSRNPGLRLLFVGIALSLVNIWVFLKWTYVSYPRRGGRDVKSELFPLTMFRQFLLEAIKAIYGAVVAISLNLKAHETAKT